MLLLPPPRPPNPPNPIEQKQNKKKAELIEQLKKIPIIQIACEKVGVGRATFYRWRKEDKEFAESVELSLDDGAYLVSDMAESKLISAIKKENLGAIIFWLKSHHPKYRTKLDLNANIRNLDEPLTPEQEALVREALRLAGTNYPNIINEKNNEQSNNNDSDNNGELSDATAGNGGSNDPGSQSKDHDHS